jgi:hypothetical protein
VLLQCVPLVCCCLQYPKGWVSDLQFRCSNPFGTEGDGASLFSAMMRATFPKVHEAHQAGQQCRHYVNAAAHLLYCMS